MSKDAFDQDATAIENCTDLFSSIQHEDWDATIACLNKNPLAAKSWAIGKTYDGDVSWRRLPIHEACIHSPTAEFLTALILSFPEGVEETDMNNRLPIHHAAVHGASISVLKALAEANPKSLTTEDAFGKFPWMCLLSSDQHSNSSDYCSKLSILSGPKESTKREGATSNNLEMAFSNEFKNDASSTINSTSLFRAVEERDWDTVLSCLAKNPADAETWTTCKAYDDEITWKRLPIHEACIHNPTVDVVKALIKAYPKGVETIDKYKRLPLHHAAVHGACLKVVKTLVEAYPDSVRAEDQFGKAPYSCLHGPSTVQNNSTEYCTIIDILADASDKLPEKLHYMMDLESTLSNEFTRDTSSNENYTSLFSAIQERAWDDVIECAKTNPQDAKVWSICNDIDGEVKWKRLPIHEACIHKPPAYIVKTLLNLYLEGAKAKDMSMRQPLHHAAVHQASLEVIEILLIANPDSVETIDSFDKTPLACLTSSSHTLVQALSRHPMYYTLIAAEQEWKLSQKNKLEVLEKDLTEKHKQEMGNIRSQMTESNRAAIIRIGEQETELQKLTEQNKVLVEQLEQAKASIHAMQVSTKEEKENNEVKSIVNPGRKMLDNLPLNGLRDNLSGAVASRLGTNILYCENSEQREDGNINIENIKNLENLPHAIMNPADLDDYIKQERGLNEGDSPENFIDYSMETNSIETESEDHCVVEQRVEHLEERIRGPEKKPICVVKAVLEQEKSALSSLETSPVNRSSREEMVKDTGKSPIRSLRAQIKERETRLEAALLKAAL